MGQGSSSEVKSTDYQPKGEYITKPLLTTELTGYQLKGEYITKTELAPYAKTSDLGNYQPKGEYVTKPQLTTDLGNYQPKGEYVTKPQLTTDLGNYVTKTELAPYETKANTLKFYQLKGEYVTKPQLTTDLGNYVTKPQLTTDLGNYVTKPQLTTDLGNYQPKGEYITKSELAPYATKASLNQLVTAGTLASISDKITSKQFILNDPNHGMKWDRNIDGPVIHGLGGGALESGGKKHMTWGGDGVWTRDFSMNLVGKPGRCVDVPQFSSNGEFACDSNSVDQKFSQNIVSGQLKGINSNKCLDATTDTWVFGNCDSGIIGQQFTRYGGLIKSVLKSEKCLDVGNKNHNANCSENNNNQRISFIQY